MSKPHFSNLFSIVIALILVSGPLWAQETIKVNVENYVRAESDYQISTCAKTLDSFGKLVHQMSSPLVLGHF